MERRDMNYLSPKAAAQRKRNRHWKAKRGWTPQQVAVFERAQRTERERCAPVVTPESLIRDDELPSRACGRPKRVGLAPGYSFAETVDERLARFEREG